MWATWWKRLPFTQPLILAIGAVLWFYYHDPWAQVLVFLGGMEMAAIIGAWWGERLKRKLDEGNDLPRR